jgi:hypothetical protein
VVWSAKGCCTSGTSLDEYLIELARSEGGGLGVDNIVIDRATPMHTV